MTIYDRSVRELACGLFDRGLGYKSAAGRLGVPARAVRQWWLTDRDVRWGELLDMGVVRRYDFETKVAAVDMGVVRRYDFETKVAAGSAVVDGGMGKPEAMERFGIASDSPLRSWCRLYREGGAEALRPKPKGRPRGVDGGMGKPEAMERFGIASDSPLRSWCRLYREGGAEALRPKPKGRPRGSR